MPLAPFTFADTLRAVDRLIEAGAPSYFITANLHYAMLTSRDPRLAAVNRQAAFLIADGMPLVWAARWQGTHLPERVAGADLVPALCTRAAEKGYRVFLLGGEPGVGDEAGRRLCARSPGLQVVGVEAPPFREPTAEEEDRLVGRIRAARPDLLFVAFGQPKGELWLARHFRALGVPAAVQIGASLDFLAGRVRRAPRWMQRSGLEWCHRLARDPRRLLARYAGNFRFAATMTLHDLGRRLKFADSTKEPG